MRRRLVLLLALAVAGCSSGKGSTADAGPDGGGGTGSGDAGPDAGARDGGPGAADAGLDAGTFDAGSDAGTVDAGLDAGGADGGLLDAGADAGPADAGAPDAGPVDAGPATYGDLDASGNWTTFDTGTVDPNSNGFFEGAVFDGRYMNFLTLLSGVVRYDTTGSFGDPAAWSAYDPSTAHPNAKGFIGGTFDGRYVYAAPSLLATRYDTSGPFDAAGSWETFDTTQVEPDGGGQVSYAGATFDGRYVYYAPNNDGRIAGGVGFALRYDTQGPFGGVPSWQEFDLTQVDPDARGFAGATFDGRYVYFASQYQSLAVRFDTQGTFTQASSWQKFDLATLFPPNTGGNAVGSGHMGLIYDGRYVYWLPQQSEQEIMSYDTRGAFTSSSSWAAYDPSPLTSCGPQLGLGTGAFDGRRLYLPPGDCQGVTPASTMLVYDTTLPLTQSSSWSVFDLTTFDTNGFLFAGAGFDGQYVYLVQHGFTPLRFDARSPPGLPPAFTGSFY